MHQGRAEMKVGVLGASRQERLAPAEGDVGLSALAQHCDGGLGRLEIFGIECKRPFERGEGTLQLVHRMAGRAEEKPRLPIVRLLLAAALEQDRRLAGPACLEQVHGIAMRISSHERSRTDKTLPGFGRSASVTLAGPDRDRKRNRAGRSVRARRVCSARR